MTHGIISLSKNRWHQGSGDLTDNKYVRVHAHAFLCNKMLFCSSDVMSFISWCMMMSCYVMSCRIMLCHVTLYYVISICPATNHRTLHCIVLYCIVLYCIAFYPCCCRIILDRRVLDWVVGLDSEINELVEGSDLYGRPNIIYATSTCNQCMHCF